jgi:predicted nucleic acid-binding protein
VIIVDTNVISELMRDGVHPLVQAWAGRQRRGDLVTTAINVMELRAGIEKLLKSRRRAELDAALGRTLDEFFGGRVLKFDIKAAFATAEWHASRRRLGKAMQTADAQIAGIAISRRIATRDVYDFEGLPIRVISPWHAPA